MEGGKESVLPSVEEEQIGGIHTYIAIRTQSRESRKRKMS